tara:strand:- start:8463 stop:8903 length:441 start_codon:yes stop_codon:yes gene_type:complete
MKTLEFLSKYAGVELTRNDNYGDWLGFLVDNVEPENHQVQTSLIVREDHLSPTGAIHGGVISGFLDSSLGCAVMTVLDKGEMCSTVDLNVKFFKPIKQGDKIIAESKVINSGRTLCSVISRVFKDGEPTKDIALATATFNRYKIQK